MLIKYILIVSLVSICLYTDIKYKKVKNKVLMPFALLGLMINLGVYGMSGVRNSVIAALIPFLILFLLYALRTLGAGDVKLFCVIGILGGENFIINNMLYSFVASGILSLFIIIRRKNFIKRIKYFFNYFVCLILSRKFVPYSDFNEHTSRDKFQFVYGIFIGTIMQIILKEIASLSFIA